MVPRPLQVTTITPPQSLIKGRRILPPSPQNQSDLTFEGIKSQAYNDPITRSRAKALSYAEVALQSSTATFQQGKNQLKGQHEVTRPAFSQEEASSYVILHEQISEDDQAENMLVLVTSTPSLEEQMQEL